MAVKKKNNNMQISHMLASIFSFSLFFYFAFYLVHGDMGYFAMRGAENKLEQVKTDYNKIKKERILLENRVKRLRPESLDLDMLDERSRAVLGFVKPDEIIIVDK